MTAPILIMAGGTGGHVFPALAVARALQARNQEIIWLGTRKGIEAELIPQAGFTLEVTRISGLRGKGVLSWLLAPFKLLVALFDALVVVIKRRPKLVLGMGGFASGPGGLAAWLLGRPLIIHEQNSVAGLTNRLLARLAREVLVAFPGSFSSKVRTRLVGNPVRREIAVLPEPVERFDDRDGPIRILVLGGSQGAHVLNQVVPVALGQSNEQPPCIVRHQCGKADQAMTEGLYKEQGVAAEVSPFIEKISEAYGWADFVICRSGALTVSELMAAGLGSVLVPYPSAVDDHQTLNAKALVDAGAARLIPQLEFTPQKLADILKPFLSADRKRVTGFAVRARSLARPEATSEVANLCLAMVEES
ncbi:MAG: undecaprenyldiphospho-muramoylpentapeptide beta-N-acetylglucosaminyltransferase [Gammaproteobacteria bacterium]|nr:undecaprenyldiphospho-muramoylpentapeptide beta-N-acetylglucosaminyltransferase [Gammaproteobacteria bacterium]